MGITQHPPPPPFSSTWLEVENFMWLIPELRKLSYFDLTQYFAEKETVWKKSICSKIYENNVHKGV